MFRHGFFLFLFIICTDHFMKYISALNVEGIVHGKLADQADFEYQVAIFAEVAKNNEHKLVCNGAVVAPYWILTIAECFMNHSRKVKDAIFTAALGFSEFIEENVVLQNIIYFYTEVYIIEKSYDELAMARTVQPMTKDSKVQPISVMHGHELFVHQEGKISGYGCSEVTETVDEHGTHTLVPEKTDLKLRYANITLNHLKNCQNDFPDMDSLNRSKFCGVTEKIEEKATGLCWNDIGSPLVIDHKLAALATRNRPTFDDTRNGSIYTETMRSYNFIKNIMQGSIKPSMKKHSLKQF